MIQTLPEPRMADVGREDMPLYSFALERLVADGAPTLAPKPEAPRQSTPAPARAPRPYAYD